MSAPLTAGPCVRILDIFHSLAARTREDHVQDRRAVVQSPPRKCAPVSGTPRACVTSARSTDAAFCRYQSASRTTRQALDSRQPSLPGCRSPRLERPAGRNHVVIVTDDLLPTP